MMQIARHRAAWLVSGLVLYFFAGSAGHAADLPEVPFAARIVLHKASNLIEKNDASAAIAVLEAFQARGGGQRSPDTADPKGYHHYLIDFTLGNCYLSINRPAAAADHYRAGLEQNPDHFPSWRNLAKCYYDLGRHTPAARAFLRGYETAPEKNAELLYYAAISFMAAGSVKDAMDTVEHLRKRHPDQIRLAWKEGIVQVFLAAQKPRRALPYLEELAEKTDGVKKKQWQEMLLYQYVSLTMQKKALSYARQLTREYPVEAKWWKALANLQLSAEQHKRALATLLVYSYLTPLTVQETKLLGDLSLMLGIPALAAGFYEVLAAERPDREAVERLVQSYLGLHQPERALAVLQRRAGNRTDDWLILEGRLLYDMKRYADAARVFETAALKKIQPGEAWLMLGYAAWQMDDADRARRAFQNAGKYSGQRKEARRLLDRVQQDAAAGRTRR